MKSWGEIGLYDVIERTVMLPICTYVIHAVG
jgi:hypothetical protein